MVDYNQAQQLHHIRINFRLPVLRSVDDLLSTGMAITKRGGSPPESIPSRGIFGAPERGKSALLDGNRMFSNGHLFGGTDLFLSVSVDYHSATLWTAPYSDYQQFLFDTIDRMHQAGNSYIKIAQWMNDNNHLTPRGAVFKPNHAWSIHIKKRKSIARFSRAYAPQITDVGIDITD